MSFPNVLMKELMIDVFVMRKSEKSAPNNDHCPFEIESQIVMVKWDVDGEKIDMAVESA